MPDEPHARHGIIGVGFHGSELILQSRRDASAPEWAEIVLIQELVGPERGGYHCHVCAERQTEAAPDGDDQRHRGLTSGPDPPFLVDRMPYLNQRP
jgi:hypothetical protein